MQVMVMDLVPLLDGLEAIRTMLVVLKAAVSHPRYDLSFSFRDHQYA